MKSANIITLVRIALVPLFMIVYLLEIPYHETIAFVLFLLASATDKLDGYIARKYNQITDFGKFIDPLADKILITAALVMLSESAVVPSWVVVLIVSREFVVTGLRTVAMSSGRVIAASSWGKAKMVVQVITVAFLLTPLRTLYLGPIAISALLIGVMTIVTIWSGADYLILNRDLFRNEI